MKCEDFMSLIDAYVDQELTGAQLREMHEHAQGCEACRREMENADLLKNYLSEMDRQVCVPLLAQAAWRNAVKAEVRGARLRRLYKSFGAVAAALLVMVGVGVGVRAFQKGSTDHVGAEDKGVGAFEFVATDGDQASPTVLKAASQDAVADKTAAIKLTAEDPAAAVETVCSLVEECNGKTETTNLGGASAYVSAYIPQADLDAFIEALDYAGQVDQCQITGDGEGDVAVTITIK